MTVTRADTTLCYALQYCDQIPDVDLICFCSRPYVFAVTHACPHQHCHHQQIFLFDVFNTRPLSKLIKSIIMCVCLGIGTRDVAHDAPFHVPRLQAVRVTYNATQHAHVTCNQGEKAMFTGGKGIDR